MTQQARRSSKCSFLQIIDFTFLRRILFIDHLPSRGYANIHNRSIIIMRKRILFLLLLIAFSSVRTLAIDPRPSLGTYVKGELLVCYRDSEASLSSRSAKSGVPLRVIRQLKRPGWYRVVLQERITMKRALERVRKMPGVLHVEPNYIYELRRVPNDPEFTRLWGLQTIGAPAAWNIGTGSPDIVVGVLDTGIQYDHDDIRENVWRNPNEVPNNQIDDDNNGYVDDIFGVDFVDGDSDPLDDDGHGSHVAGIIGASGDNEMGVVGVNWQVAIMALRIVSTDGFATTDSIADALDYLVDMKTKGVNIVAINNSWGGPNSSQILFDSFKIVADSGILIVCAAGNAGRNSDFFPEFPANYDIPGLMSVAAVSSQDMLAGFSNFGTHSVDLAAPGTTILSLHKDNDSLAYLQGTSMSAPHVTGAAALLSSIDPSLSVTALKSLIMGGAERLENLQTKVASGGRLNLEMPLTVINGDSRVDLVVGSSPATVIVGQDQYLSATEQSIEGIASFVDPAIYYLQLENDGCCPDTLTVGSFPDLDESWEVKFYDGWSGGADITDEVLSDTWKIMNLAPDGTMRLRAQIKPAQSNILNDKIQITVRSRSDNSAVFDQVNMITRTETLPAGIRLASKSDSGKSSNNRVLTSVISGSGRFVLFTSEATNLVPNDTNNKVDVFVHDLILNKTEILSATATGQLGTEDSEEPSISADGRYVVYHTFSAMDSSDINNASDIYLKDRDTGELRRISKRFGGGIPNNSSFDARISADGSSVAFYSFASDIVADDTNLDWDVFVYDIDRDSTEIVSLSSTGTIGNGTSIFPSINEDGSIIGFSSQATNLTSHNHLTTYLHVYLRDRSSATTQLISVSDSGEIGNANSGPPFVSGDGNWVVYDTAATNLISGQTNEHQKVILRDWRNSTNELVSFSDSGAQPNQDSTLPATNFDGRFITFTSVATNLFDIENSEIPRVYLWDRLTGFRHLVGTNEVGVNPGNTVWGGTFSNDGQMMAFNSWANNLSYEDGNGSSDVFAINLGRVRPNAMIAREGSNTFIGDSVIGINISQRQSQEIVLGDSATYTVRIVNQGVIADRLILTSTNSMAGWQIHFLIPMIIL